nr:hypothetical protein [Deltaproteobacteria bacterium]
MNAATPAPSSLAGSRLQHLLAGPDPLRLGDAFAAIALPLLVLQSTGRCTAWAGSRRWSPSPTWSPASRRVRSSTASTAVAS